ncbi:MAG: hypothetical protein V3W34_04825 [Phycisphaerae bacterium]
MANGEYEYPFAIRHLPFAIQPAHWLIIAVLAVIEVAVSFYLASVNPVAGWDEAAYRINALCLMGNTNLSYVHHRPPLFPILIVLAGGFYRFIPALAHIGATVLLFVVLRRLASPAVAVGGALLLMFSGDLRFLNMLVLTELVSVFLLLLLIHLFISDRPVFTGAIATLMAVLHWQMLTILPVVLAVYCVMRRWRLALLLLGGAALTAAPFLTASAMVYGNPLHPILANFSLNTEGFANAVRPLENDWWYYWGAWPAIRWPLLVGGLAALFWLATNWRQRRRIHRYDLVALLVGVILLQLLPLHLIRAKDTRLLVPIIPPLLLVSILMLRHYAQHAPWASYVAWPTMFLSLFSIMPGRNLLWEISDLKNDPVNQLVAIKGAVRRLHPDETVYTEVNDLAVMAHTGHPTVAVTGGPDHHFRLIDRPQCRRDAVPPGALYLTWDPAHADIIASAAGNRRRGTLYLVRW